MAFAGSTTVGAGAAGGLIAGGPAGHNRLTGSSGAGHATIFGGGDGDVLRAGTGAGDILLAGGGAETLSAAGTNGLNQIYGGPGPNLIEAGDGVTSVLLGTGATTLAGGAGLALFAFTDGNANTVLIGNFNPALDYLSLVGFPAREAAGALASATTITGGGAPSEVLTLSDGTVITLHGFTGLTAANFL